MAHTTAIPPSHHTAIQPSHHPTILPSYHTASSFQKSSSPPSETSASARHLQSRVRPEKLHAITWRACMHTAPLPLPPILHPTPAALPLILQVSELLILRVKVISRRGAARGCGLGGASIYLLHGVNFSRLGQTGGAEQSTARSPPPSYSPSWGEIYTAV